MRIQRNWKRDPWFFFLAAPWPFSFRTNHSWPRESIFISSTIVMIGATIYVESTHTITHVIPRLAFMPYMASTWHLLAPAMGYFWYSSDHLDSRWFICLPISILGSSPHRKTLGHLSMWLSLNHWVIYKCILVFHRSGCGSGSAMYRMRFSTQSNYNVTDDLNEAMEYFMSNYN